MTEKPNWFVRLLIVLMSIALLAMAYTSFFFKVPAYEISIGILTIFALVIVLTLSEAFNNMSVGKLINLSREVEKKTGEIETVKNENSELRGELFKIVSNIQQSQVNNTYNAPSDEWLKLLGVVKATEPDDDEEKETDSETQRAVEYLAERERMRAESRQRRELRQASEAVAFTKFAANLAVPESEIIRGAEFSQAFDEIDPIMSRKIVFDGYIKGPTLERFIEVRPKRMVSTIYYDRLYVMLNKIFLYRQAKGGSAELILLLADIEGDDDARPWSTERFYEYFQPAISNKLLKIENIKISTEELESRSTQRELL